MLVGSVEWLTRSLFWNDQVIRSNEFHTYFRVNSVFWDPNIYGRYLALVIVVAMAALLWATRTADSRAADGASRRPLDRTVRRPSRSRASPPCWRAWQFLPPCAGACAGPSLRSEPSCVIGVLVVFLAGGKASFNRLNIDTSGRANLVSGGIHLFAQRPIYGYGSGCFPKAYRDHVQTKKAPVSVSHTEPITVAAEQGLVGLVAYAALVVTALWTMATTFVRRCPAYPHLARVAL